MKFNAKKITTLAIFAALSIILVAAIHFPIFPAALFLEYDPADIPIFFSTFLFGPGAGLILTVVASVIQGITVSAQSGVIGILMHVFATGCFVLTAGLIYRKHKTTGRLIAAAACGLITMVASMVVWNLIFTPLFGTPLEVVLSIMVPVIIPFNLIKGGVNAVIALLLYGALGKRGLLKKVFGENL